MDRGYSDFARLQALHRAGGFFVTRATSNWDAHRVYSRAVDRNTGWGCEQTLALDGFYPQQEYPDHWRRIRCKDAESGKRLVFLSNHCDLPALTIGMLSKSRGPVDLFFNWIQPHLRIKQCYGTAEHAVKTPIWIAVSVYVLVAIVQKRLNLEASLYTLLPILSVTLFEKISLQQAVTTNQYKTNQIKSDNQLDLFEFLTGH